LRPPQPLAREKPSPTFHVVQKAPLCTSSGDASGEAATTAKAQQSEVAPPQAGSTGDVDEPQGLVTKDHVAAEPSSAVPSLAASSQSGPMESPHRLSSPVPRLAEPSQSGLLENPHKSSSPIPRLAEPSQSGPLESPHNPAQDVFPAPSEKHSRPCKSGAPPADAEAPAHDMSPSVSEKQSRASPSGAPPAGAEAPTDKEFPAPSEKHSRPCQSSAPPAEAEGSGPTRLAAASALDLEASMLCGSHSPVRKTQGVSLEGDCSCGGESSQTLRESETLVQEGQGVMPMEGERSSGGKSSQTPRTETTTSSVMTPDSSEAGSSSARPSPHAIAFPLLTDSPVPKEKPTSVEGNAEDAARLLAGTGSPGDSYGHVSDQSFRPLSVQVPLSGESPSHSLCRVSPPPRTSFPSSLTPGACEDVGDRFSTSSGTPVDLTIPNPMDPPMTPVFLGSSSRKGAGGPSPFEEGWVTRTMRSDLLTPAAYLGSPHTGSSGSALSSPTRFRDSPVACSLEMSP
jgi:hypothetical protein